MRHGLMLLAMFAFSLAAMPAICGEADEAEEYEAVPEGFEERLYVLHALLRGAESMDSLDESGGHSNTGPRLDGEHVMAMIRHAAGPDTWTKRGAARMQVDGGVLTVLQKKEVHDEIAKVLAWLQDGVAVHTRTTLVIAALKPEQLAKIENGVGVIAPADLFKMIEEAGENSASITELRGREGQDVVVAGSLRQNMMRDVDVSGGVYDPVMAALATGVVASAKVLRTPDAQSARVDLGARVYGTIEAAQMEIRLRGVGVRSVTTTQRITQSDKPDKKDEVRDEQHPGALRPVDMDTALKIDTPRQPLADLKATVIAPRGQFVLAGVLDLAAGDGKATDRRAVLVRSDAGQGSVPTLLGVSGLKEGEIFKLYPMDIAMEDVPDNLAPNWAEPRIYNKVPLGAALSHIVANPFTAAPTSPPALRALNTQMIQSKFSERVRKNKLVESYGNTLFTRLNAEDHVKLAATVTTPIQIQLSGVRVRAVVLALPQTAYRKLLLDDAKIDDAALQTLLATPNAARLADAAQVVQANQTASSFAGKSRQVLTDYDISGDLHDPNTSALLEQGYVLEAHYTPQATNHSAQVSARLRLYPGNTKIENMPFDTFAVGGGFQADYLLRMTGDLSRMKIGVVNLQGAVNAPKGQFVIASSAPMPPDAEGKADPRQAVLLLRVEDSAKP